MSKVSRCPVPWCEHGDNVEIETEEFPPIPFDGSESHPFYRVRCLCCGVHGGWFEALADAVDRWNRGTEFTMSAELIRRHIDWLAQETIEVSGDEAIRMLALGELRGTAIEVEIKGLLFLIGETNGSAEALKQ